VKKTLALALSALSLGGAATFAASESIDDAFKNGKFKGTIGTYFEQTDADADGKDFGWQTGYFLLKYETDSYKNLKLGMQFLGHTQIYNDLQNGADKYESDIEDKIGMPELYLDYSFTDKTSLRAGRFNHQKLTHIDDAQSEGFYLLSKELKNVQLVLGAITQFAEMDYDDMEDFGRENDSQDLSDDSFGDDSDDYLMFAEATVKLPGDLVTLNPYFYTQDGYASVYGMDAKLTAKAEGFGYGARANYYHVSADNDDYDDASVYAFAPYVSVGPFTLTVGRAQFDDSDKVKGALNKPDWFKDYVVGVLDQDKSYGEQDCSVNFAKLAYKQGKFGAHLAYGDYDFDAAAGKASGTQELEFQTTYKFTKHFDGNVRLFDVSYDDAEDKDYQKIEARVRYKF
jgi:hypothetical protein